MSESNGPDERAEKTRRFSQEQYDLLMRCSERKDMTEWDEWRVANPEEVIYLEGAKVFGAHLEGANLCEAHLEGAKVPGAHLEGANLIGAHLEGVLLSNAHLEGADLCEAHLEGAILFEAHLEGANLCGAHLEGAHLSNARLEGAFLSEAHLEGAALYEAHLEGADLFGAHLEGADFQFAAVDGQTLIACCQTDRETEFLGVGLGSARIAPGLRQLLEYNIRRRRWEEWYGVGSRWRRILKNVLVRPFWWMSDYGRSTGRIAGSFFGLAAMFAVIYWLFPGCLEGPAESGPAVRGLFHALYFSVVTMTTLGFGDIHAAPDSPWGQGLLMVQVLLGYILLAALVTRLAILFTAGGPADGHSPSPRLGEDRSKGDN